MKNKASAANILLIAAALILFPSAAHANMGTPLLLAGIFHLWVGNALIGMGEGWLLARRFKLDIERSAGIMILANYVSAFAGYMAVMHIAGGYNPWGLSVNIYNLPVVEVAGGFAIIALTVLIEWPFCRWALRSKSINKISWGKAFKASLLVQSASYAILIPWFLCLSGFSFYRQLDIDKSLSFARNIPAVVYYISGNNIYSVRPDGTGRLKELEFSTTSDYAYLVVREYKKSGRHELWLRRCPDEYSDTLLCKSLSPGCRLTLGKIEEYGTEHKGTVGYDGRQDFRPEGISDWDIEGGHWLISARNRKTGEKIYARLEMPLAIWLVGDQHLLPDDKLIYDFGPQILVLDLDTRKVGILAMGHSPMVVLYHGKEIVHEHR